jgi:uncharacterized repeat protein (TIGR03837 family)
MAPRLWDIYCRVIDNLGDAGVCWRLAVQLAARGQCVRLVIDNPAPLAFMAPNAVHSAHGTRGVHVLPWPGPTEPGDVVIEAFGCDLPPANVTAMALRQPPPVWLNLEYLSAESYVERSHGLPSPQPNGLTKWFYFPGFTPRTGGLLREPGLAAERAAFDRLDWLRCHGIDVHPEERIVALFCYANAALPALWQDLARRPTLLLVTPGPAAEQLDRLGAAAPGLRVQRLPWLSQPDFDRLLWSADLNFVRGEDSLVRALWADRPFVWQAYPQADGAHVAKVEALLERMQPSAPVAALWRAWNGLGAAWPGLPWPWPAESASTARDALQAQGDLVTQLLDFVEARRNLTPG